METYIQLSKLNDFIFCPRSLYFHEIYESFSTKVYHDRPQVEGKLKHATIDKGTYSSEKRYLQGMSVYSEKYGIAGKIDIFDQKTGALIERKAKIKKLYDGYYFQLYGEYFCLKEMGYDVRSLFFHSLDDNRRYSVALPSGEMLRKFDHTIATMQRFRIEDFPPLDNVAKCDNCIYRPLCH